MAKVVALASHAFSQDSVPLVAVSNFGIRKVFQPKFHLLVGKSEPEVITLK